MPLKIYKISLTIFILVCGLSLWSQRLNGDSELALTLKDGTQVVLYKTYQFQEESHLYYYLPVNLRFSVKKDNTPEFSFLSYKEHADGEISGALMHWLMTWGLNNEQENQVQHLLSVEIDSVGILMGAVPVKQIENEPGFEIVCDDPIADIMRNSLKSAGAVPLFPGGKLAASFFFDADDAKAMDIALKDPEGLENIIILFRFQLPELHSTRTNTLIRQKHILRSNFKKLIEPTTRLTNE